MRYYHKNKKSVLGQLLMLLLAVVFIVASGISLPMSAQPNQTAVNQSTKPVFEAGQVWTYKCRKQDKGSTLTVIKVEKQAGKTIVHVRLEGINIENPGKPHELLHTAAHLPIDGDAVSQSVLKLLRTNAPIPDDSMQGYEEWRRAVEAHHAGVFSIPVAAVVERLQITLTTGSKKSVN